MSSIDNDFKKIQTQVLGDKIKGIFESLTTIAETDVKRLPEAVFFNTFLPFFAGLPVPPEVNLGMWSAIAGNPYKEVHVVGEKGEVLYTVPPLFDREAIDINKVDKRLSPMQHVMITYEQYLRISPVRARQYLDNELASRNITTTVQPNVLKNLKTWNEIFARYNMPLIAGGPETGNSNNENTKPELDYDDGIL